MIQPLRRIHRLAFAGVALAVPAILIAAWVGRRPPPGVNELPTGVESGETVNAEVVFESEELWRTTAISTRILRDGAEPPTWWVELEPTERLQQPDLLLYWSPTAPDIRDPSYLLGAFEGHRPQRFRLPSGHDPRQGYLVLYSLAHQTVFATAEAPD